MTDAAEAPDGAIRRPGPATIDPAEAEAENEEHSDGYVESDDDGGGLSGARKAGVVATNGLSNTIRLTYFPGEYQEGSLGLWFKIVWYRNKQVFEFQLFCVCVCVMFSCLLTFCSREVQSPHVITSRVMSACGAPPSHHSHISVNEPKPDRLG